VTVGSATRQALVAASAALDAADGVDLPTAEQLLDASRSISGSAQLRAILADQSTDADTKKQAVRLVFGRALTPTAVSLLETVAGERWSTPDDLVGGVEELGIRAAAQSAGSGAAIEAELFAFGRAVSTDPRLELAVGSKLGAVDQKVGLVVRLLGDKVSAQTLAIVRHIVALPRGRRIGAALRYAASVVAEQAGLAVATITSARPIGAEQLQRLQRGLSNTYGRELRINAVVDPALIGGLRVQVGDGVIDGSVASRLSELRLQLAG